MERPLGSALPPGQQQKVDMGQENASEGCPAAGFPGMSEPSMPPFELENILHTDSTSDFDLARELWQYF